MSKLPKISAHNSEGFKSTFTDSKPSQPVPVLNGNDVYSYDSLPAMQNRSSIPTVTSTYPSTSRFNSLIAETKLNELETKLISLEESNAFLIDRLRTYERTHELQLKDLANQTMTERESRLKVEKLMSILTDQTSINTSDLKARVGFIQEIMEKEEKWKFEQRERDIELYKSLINKLTDKVSETVKIEIEARFKADMDNKLLTEKMTKKMLTEFDLVRKEIEDFSTETQRGLKDNSKECAERAQNLSKYVDELIANAFISPNKNYDQLKMFVNKLTDQIKSNLISQREQNDIYDKKFLNLEVMTQNIKEDVYKFVNLIEERLIGRVLDLRNFIEINLKTNFDNLNNRITELSKGVDSNFGLISTQLVDTREKLSNKIQVMEKDSHEKFKATCEDLTNLANRMYSYEDLLLDYEKRANELKVNVDKDIANFEAKYEIHKVNERMLHVMEHDELKDEMEKLRDNVMEFSAKMLDDLNDLMGNTDENQKNLYERSNMAFKQMNELAQNNYDMFNELNRNVEKLKEDTDRVEVETLMHEMLGEIEDKELREDVTKCRNVESYLHKSILNLEEHVKKIKGAQDNSSIKSDVNAIISDILGKIEFEELISNAQEANKNFMDNELRLEHSLKQVEMQQGVFKGKLFDIEKELELLKQVKDEEKENKAKENEEKKVQQEMEQEQNRKKEEELMKKLEEMVRQMEDKKEERDKIDSGSSTQPSGMELEVKCTLDQIVNNLEFNNIYSLIESRNAKNDQKNNEVLEKLTEFNKMIFKIDKNLTESNETTKQVLLEYNNVIDSKVNGSLEKLKQQNINMWVNAVELSQKVNQPDEIRKIIQQVPPVVIPKKESMKMIYELEHDQNKTPNPVLKFDLTKNKRQVKKETERKGNKDDLIPNNDTGNVEDNTNKPNESQTKQDASSKGMVMIPDSVKDKDKDKMDPPAKTAMSNPEDKESSLKKKTLSNNSNESHQKNPNVSNKNLDSIR